MTPTGRELFELGFKHQNEKYVLGVIVPKNDKEWIGPWDCAEFASWLVFQVSGKLYGCANNHGNPESADAYSGFWVRDGNNIGTKVNIATAAATRGAVLLRIAGPGLIGHAAISDGLGGTVEAHSSKYGVILSKVGGRRWDFGVLVPWLSYETRSQAPAPSESPRVLRYKIPLMFSEKIKEIQKALAITSDGYYGAHTFQTVREFQRNSGLVADGEVGPKTAEKLGVSL